MEAGEKRSKLLRIAKENFELEDTKSRRKKLQNISALDLRDLVFQFILSPTKPDCFLKLATYLQVSFAIKFVSTASVFNWQVSEYC